MLLANLAVSCSLRVPCTGVWLWACSVFASMQHAVQESGEKSLERLFTACSKRFGKEAEA
jgi:hypothetical protein